jgi:AI-2 transport protein TqsA
VTRLVAHGSRRTLTLRGNGRGPAPGPPDASPTFPRGLVVLLGLAGAAVTVAGLRAIADLLGPVFLALMLTVTVSPLTTWLRRYRVPGWAAMLITVATVYVVLTGFAVAMIAAAARLVELIPTYQDQFAALRADLTHTLANLGIDVQQVKDLVGQADPGGVARIAGALFGGVAATISNAVFLIALLLFMCVDTVNFPARLAAAAPQRPQVIVALRSFAGGTRRYLIVSSVFGLIVATIDTLALWALGIPLPMLWGLLAFITNYVPNIGFVIGLAPPAVLGLLEGGPKLMVTVIVLYCVVNFVIQSVIQPKIVGDAVGLSATVSFLSLVFWAWVLGPLGALLAIPLTLLTKSLLVDIDPSTEWLNVLLAGGGAPERNGGGPAPERKRSGAVPERQGSDAGRT